MNNIINHIVIIGGGFAGLNAANTLKYYKNIHITIIDKNNYSLFQPFLYQVATCDLSPSDITASIRKQFRGYKNVSVVMDEVKKINKINKEVLISSGNIFRYDYLIIATGSENNFFGNDNWSENVISLKNINDALAIRNSLLKAFERAELTNDLEKNSKDMTFIIIGGGPTGVELAGSLRDSIEYTLKYDFNNIKPTDVKIILIEAGPRLLSSFDTRLSLAAKLSLEKRNILIKLNSKVKTIETGKVILETGEVIESSLLIWGAGIKATNIKNMLEENIELGQGGKVKVNPDLTLVSDQNIFIVGDLSEIVDSQGKVLPSLAAVASQQGKFVGKLISSKINGRKYKSKFVYNNWGNLAIISRYSALIEYKKLKLEGIVAWLIWNIIHIYFLIGFRNRLIVFIKWIWHYITHDKSERIILEQNNKK